jgi:DNA-binding response OmpR family regulator
VESLAATRAPGIELARNQASALGAAGLGTVEALAQAARDDLKRIVPARTAARLQAWARGQGAASPEPQSPAAGGPVLVVDDRVPDRIVIDGRDVSLQDRQYRLVRVLASSPGECVPYERIYEAVWGDLVVEQNQLSAQKSALLRRVAEASPGRRSLVQTVPKRGFRLALDPADVCLRAAGATV